MSQRQLDRAVARVTGENLRIITRLGFSLADPLFVEHDPEPCDIEDMIMDWDACALRRNMPLFAQGGRSPIFV